MKRILLTLLIIGLSFSLFANTSDTDNIGSYAVIFSVKYKNSNYNFSSIKIKNNLCLDSNLNSTSCNNDQNEYHFTTEDFYTYHSKTDTSYISTKVKNCNIRISSYGEGNYGYSYKVVGNITNKYNRISILPINKTIATGDIGGYYINEGGTYNNVSIDSEYNLEIRPLEIECTNLGTTSDETDLIYDELICIKATKGFPKDVYKWRYSYKNAQGILIEGDLYPYRTEDNGATIYVRGSDFLSETTFYDLVYNDENIFIIPDGANGVFKPLSTDSVKLTAKPSAPRIKTVTFDKPKCPNKPATNVTVHLSRAIAQGENIILQLIDFSDNQKKIEINASICGSDKISIGSIEAKKWEVIHFKTTYKNITGKDVPSYSEGDGMHAYIEISAPDSLSLESINSTKTLCYGDSNGATSCYITGGTGSKTYSLYRDDELIRTQTKDSSDVCVFTELPKGTYTISTTDINGCRYEKDASINIEEPRPISISAYVDSIPKCQGSYDGGISYNTSGGTGNIICYLQNLLHEVKDSTYSNSFSELSAGTYYLSAKDTNGCTSNTTGVTLEAPEALSLSLETKNVTINGTNNGSLSASFSGGTEPYTLSFDNKELNYQFPLDDVLINSNMYAGEGTVTLLDNNECSTSATYNITEPDTISAIVKQIDFIKCFGDNTASLQIDSIAGGMGGYTIEWFEDGDFISKDTSISSLPAGEYWVFVKDSVGAVKDYVITIDEPKKINLLSSVTNTACVGEASGSILLNANGGTAPYKFSLNEQYSSSGEYNQLEAGYYNISVEDENGCKTEDTVEVKTLSDINLNVTSSSPTCYGIDNGSISITIDNGESPYSVHIADKDYSEVKGNLNLTDLKAGYYNIEVKDSLGCIKTADAILTEPTEFNIELPEKIYLCNEQSEVVNIENERVTNVDWYLNNDLVHTGLNHVLYQEGVYKLDFLYDNLCHSFGKIEIDTINKKVDVNFLVAAEIPINDDAHLLNITKAENYDYQEWIYPTNDAWVYGEDENSLQLVFLKEGSWNVGLISYLDKCTASQFKTVKTFIPDSNFEQEENTYLISELSIDKSPNNGKFTAKIELSDKTDIKLYLYNASNGHIIDSKEATGEKSYEIPFSVSTTTGEYILLAVAPTWQKSKWIKMIIK